MMKPRTEAHRPGEDRQSRRGEEAFITVAAVDVGILNLTRYDPPAPENYYYDQKRLTAELRDIYGVLIDGMQGERGKLRSGGDGGAAFNAPPPAQKPLASIPASSRWPRTAPPRSTSTFRPSTAPSG